MAKPLPARCPSPTLAIAFAGILSVLILWSSAVCAADERSREFQIKAAFVFNFAKFLEWPAGRFAGPEQPITIGVLGETPLAAELESLVKDRRINGRAVLVRSASSLDDLRDLHLLFVGANCDHALKSIQAAAKDRGVLTVGETPAFEAAGGMITFRIEGDKVRFAINISAAEQARLKISAQLQQLATVVHRAP
jgi:hypothetical protein